MADVEKLRRLEAKRQRQANILAKMSKMQRKFMDTHYREMLELEDNDTHTVS